MSQETPKIEVFNTKIVIHNYNIDDSPEFENFFKTGVIDPAKVTRLAIENAASISGLLITSDCVISDIKEEKQMNCGHQNGMNDGMM